MRDGSSNGVTELDHGRYVRDAAYRKAVHYARLTRGSSPQGLLPHGVPIHDHDRPGELHIFHDADRTCCEHQPWMLTIHQLGAELTISSEP